MPALHGGDAVRTCLGATDAAVSDVAVGAGDGGLRVRGTGARPELGCVRLMAAIGYIPDFLSFDTVGGLCFTPES